MSRMHRKKKARFPTELAILERRGRDRLFIMAEVLDIAKEGALKTYIMYNANLSFAQLNQYLSLLIDIACLKVVKEHGRTIYKTTEKGLVYLNSYREIGGLLGKGHPQRKFTSQLSKIKFGLRDLKKAIESLETSLTDWVTCPRCDKDIFPEYEFCPFCGKKLKLETTIGAKNETTRN